ncbi:MAG: protein-export chaperone SecB [Oceanococcaceae bacterium]
MTETNAAANGAANTPSGPRVQLQKIYMKDASVEVPNAPQIFTKSFQPKVDVQLNTEVSTLNAEAHQVLLSATVTARQDEDVAYLVEVHMAGVLLLNEVKEGPEKQALLGAWAPNTIFPFLREAVSDLVQKAGFPPFLLQPVNFDAALREHLGRQKTEAGAGEGAAKH